MAVYDEQDRYSPENVKRRSVSEGDANNPKSLEERATKETPVIGSSKKSLTGDNLKSIEEEATDEPGFFKDTGGATSSKKSSFIGRFSGRKKLLIAGSSGGILFIVAVVLMVFLASLKPVHFGQVLSTASFARLQLVLRERAAQNLFDSAVVDGTGSATLENRTLMDRLRRINPEAQLAQLGAEGKLKLEIDKGKTWTGRGVNEFKGVQIEGRSISLDEIAKKQGYGSWSELNSGTNKALKVRERMAVRAEFVNEVKFGIENTLKLDSRSVRSSVYDGIRQTSGIKLNRWRQRAREFVGKTPAEAYAENRKQSFKETAPDAVSGTDPTTEDVIKKSRENINKAIDDGLKGDIVAQSVTSAAQEAQFARVASTVSTGVLISTLACMVNQAAVKLEDATEINQDNAMRLAHEAMTGADQIRYGDSTAEAVSADSKRWDGADLSPEYQRQMNGKTDYPVPEDSNVPSVTPKIDPTVLGIVNIVTSPSTLTPVGNSELGEALDENFCNFILDPKGQLAIAGTEIVLSAVAAAATGGTAPVAGEAVEQTAVRVFGQKVLQGSWQAFRGVFSAKGGAQVAGFGIIQLAIDYSVYLLGGISYSGTEEGANLYSKSVVGGDLLEKENLRQGLYGRALSDEEVQQNDEDAQTALKEQNQSRPWTERYFATSNPYSLVSMAAGSTPSSISGAGRRAGSWFGSMGSALSVSRLMPKPSLAGAATNIDHHGVPQWGFSRDEIDKLTNDASYTIEENEAWIAAKGGIEAVQKKLDTALGFAVESCFKAKRVTEVPEGCSADKLKTEEAFRYRIYKGLDSYTVGMLEEDLTPKGGNTADTSGAITTDIISGDTSNQTCPVGEDAGVGDGYENGKLYKIRLCKIQGSVVNSQYANNFNNMLNAAKADGVDLGGGGGFRTMQQQIATRIANNCPDIYNSPAKSCSPQTARPGYSNHQMGFANDFLCGKSIISSRSSPCFKWLAANAARFGYINLPAEPWHWSRDGK